MIRFSQAAPEQNPLAKQVSAGFVFEGPSVRPRLLSWTSYRLRDAVIEFDNRWRQIRYLCTLAMAAASSLMPGPIVVLIETPFR
jgi:hypothetical protein